MWSIPHSILKKLKYRGKSGSIQFVTLVGGPSQLPQVRLLHDIVPSHRSWLWHAHLQPHIKSPSPTPSSAHHSSTHRTEEKSPHPQRSFHRLCLLFPLPRFPSFPSTTRSNTSHITHLDSEFGSLPHCSYSALLPLSLILSPHPIAMIRAIALPWLPCPGCANH